MILTNSDFVYTGFLVLFQNLYKTHRYGVSRISLLRDFSCFSNFYKKSLKIAHKTCIKFSESTIMYAFLNGFGNLLINALEKSNKSETTVKYKENFHISKNTRKHRYCPCFWFIFWSLWAFFFTPFQSSAFSFASQNGQKLLVLYPKRALFRLTNVRFLSAYYLPNFPDAFMSNS